MCLTQRASPWVRGHTAQILRKPWGVPHTYAPCGCQPTCWVVLMPHAGPSKRDGTTHNSRTAIQRPAAIATSPAPAAQAHQEGCGPSNRSSTPNKERKRETQTKRERHQAHHTVPAWGRSLRGWRLDRGSGTPLTASVQSVLPTNPLQPTGGSCRHSDKKRDQPETERVPQITHTPTHKHTMAHMLGWAGTQNNPVRTARPELPD